MSDVLGRVAALFDAYSRTARLTPGLLLLLGPVGVAIGAGVPDWPGATALIAAAAAMGLPLALADWVRRRGQRLQAQLWASWGGSPVEAALRGEGLIARRRRDALAAATGLPVRNPDHKDFEEAITNGVRRLISATRDTSQYPLVFAENKNYGFARNLLAIRPIGVAASILSLGGGIVLVAASIQLDAMSALGTMLGAVAAAVITAFWMLYPSEDRVRRAASDYRDRLLEALDAGALVQ